MAFNSKNLHYEKQEPAFLRRLKSIHNAADGRHGFQVARPKNARLKTGDGDEDEPLILNEQGDIIAKTEFEDMQKGDGDGNNKVDVASDHASGGEGGPASQNIADRAEAGIPREAQQIAGIGRPKKRKQARTIGVHGVHGVDEADPNSDPEADVNDSRVSATSEETTVEKWSDSVGGRAKQGKGQVQVQVQRQQQQQPPKTKAKKKTKKIKLSFDEPE